MPKTVIGAFMSGFHGEGKFLKALLDTSKFALEIHRSLGATINQITKKDFSLMSFSVPIHESEREQIANTVTLLDNLIVANERQEKIALIRSVQFSPTSLINFEYFR